MKELEDRVAGLVREGFYPNLNRGNEEWTCTLFNSLKVPHRPPVGRGKSALIALLAAVSDLRQLEAEELRRRGG